MPLNKIPSPDVAKDFLFFISKFGEFFPKNGESIYEGSN